MKGLKALRLVLFFWMLAILSACGGGGSSSGGGGSPTPTITPDFFAMPPNNDPNGPLGNTTTTCDSTTGHCTVSLHDNLGNVTQTIEMFNDATGWKENTESVWVTKSNWSVTTTQADSNGIRSDHQWDTPFTLVFWGMKVGDQQVEHVFERVIVRSSAAQTALGGSCGGTDWNVTANGKAGTSNPYVWEFIQQTRTTTVVDIENVILPSSEVVIAFKVQFTTEETNNPFNGSTGVCGEPGNHSSFTRTIWLAKGRGIVKFQ